MIQSVSKLSTKVAPQPPNVLVLGAPDIGESSSCAHARSLYDFQHRVKVSFTAFWRDTFSFPLSLDAASNERWTAGLPDEGLSEGNEA